MSTVLENISKEINNPLKREDIAMAHRLGLFSKTHAQPPQNCSICFLQCRKCGLLQRGRISIYCSIPKSPVYENDQLVAVQQSASRSNPTSDMQEEISIFGVLQWEGAN